MKLLRLSEPELIAAIRKDFPAQKRTILVNIGDDAAVLKPDKGLLIVTKDLLIEGTHFRREWGTAYLLGRKSLAVNLSDLAAMGGRPLYCLLGLGLPSSLPPSWVEDFMAGLKSLCQQEKIFLVGGDLSRSRAIVISITVIGKAKKYITRSGAQAGDTIWISGYPGLAAAGLQLLRKKKTLGRSKQAKKSSVDILIKAFLDPVAQIRLGSWLAQNDLATSMIDTSDGLSIDLNHLCEESGVGAEIDSAKIPIHPSLQANFPDPWPFILYGGEDYQLLFTVSPSKRKKVMEASRRFRLHEIGRISQDRHLWLVDRGRRRLLKPAGFQHFNS